MTLQLLGGMTVKQFLSRHWQKRPLLIRNAIPDFKGILQPTELLRLAQRDDVESRWVARDGGRWLLRHGPFTRTDLARAPARAWTLLVQGVNLVDARADALLQRFAFVPHARLDDLMVSYAVPAGGVGPHRDSYDVFLLQGQGRRRWRAGRSPDATLVRGAPLKVLRGFTPEHEWVLDAGDMLYLPPGYAHDGVALDACMTYSIGFRAPSARELGAALLARLEDTLHERAAEERYTDRAATAASRPGRIPAGMAAFAMRAAAAIRARPADVDIALGEYLSEPKPHVSFDPPPRPLSEGLFAREARARGVRMDARSRLLYQGSRVFVNGDTESAPRADRAVITRLADARKLAPGILSGLKRGTPLCGLLHRWYLAGWIGLDGKMTRGRDTIDRNDAGANGTRIRTKIGKRTRTRTGKRA
jgi:50S ribosomal protein L16 3-hydroxylase